MKHIKLFEQENFEDPFGEETKGSVTPEQREFLIMLAMQLADFKRTYEELRDMFTKSSSKGIDINDFITDNYPFHVSFDELEIKKWYESIRESYHKLGV